MLADRPSRTLPAAQVARIRNMAAWYAELDRQALVLREHRARLLENIARLS